MVDFWECGLIFQRLKSESVSVNVFHLLFADEKERGRERLIFQRLKSESVSVNVFHLLFADEKERGRERERWW